MTKPTENLLVKIEMPIYKQKKKGKMLLAWNQLSLLHYRSRNTLKVWYNDTVTNKLLGEAFDGYDGLYESIITLYYENSRCDMSNVCSIADKFFLDTAQTLGIVTNDNVKRYVKATYIVGGQDKENPRVEIELYKIKENKDD